MFEVFRKNKKCCGSRVYMNICRHEIENVECSKTRRRYGKFKGHILKSDAFDQRWMVFVTHRYISRYVHIVVRRLGRHCAVEAEKRG